MSESLASLGADREFYRWRDRLGFEGEGQLAAHRGGSGSHAEFVAALNVRWWKFPWHETLVTTCAVGDGLSHATQVPEHERRGHARGRVWSCRVKGWLPNRRLVPVPDWCYRKKLKISPVQPIESNN